jgi:phosphate starvation-inducible PhoH-like protein
MALTFLLIKKGQTLRKTNKRSKKTKVVDATNSLQPVPEIYRNRLKPRTDNQKEYLRTILESNITFCQGVAGSGKTHCAVGLAIEHLLDEKVKKIIITRPVVEAGEKIGFLPGDADSKLHPYLLPILDEINHFIPLAHYTSLKLNNRIEVVPLGLMRGRNFNNCFIIADECQNASYEQLKMLITRLGKDSKMVLTGDISQSDLQKHLQGGFYEMIEQLEGIEGIGISRLQFSDIVRHPIIAKILSRLDTYENKNETRK